MIDGSPLAVEMEEEESPVEKIASERAAEDSTPRRIEVAKKVGEAIEKSGVEKGITKVAFDRTGYTYRGRLEALAAAAREHSLQF
ncbi:Ribosomal protein L18 [Arabidopsis thaliana x Arabidopsis arenosa]|uniref:Ribosomal protein L18 n=1 Tax=Arabidopsis thaliana x Arabidopsis arenosa TaxID=1240361 RepID=A0A8T2ATV1_9BRAS|nr:Ribosomal protein L18 [Arabidopsis thaliana x Arabidopsis arenosa]